MGPVSQVLIINWQSIINTLYLKKICFFSLISFCMSPHMSMEIDRQREAHSLFPYRSHSPSATISLSYLIQRKMKIQWSTTHYTKTKYWTKRTNQKPGMNWDVMTVPPSIKYCEWNCIEPHLLHFDMNFQQFHL